MKHKQYRAPAAKAGSAGEEVLAKSERRNSPRSLKKSKGNYSYYLWVDCKSVEHRLEGRERESLLVIIKDGSETTITRNIRSVDGYRCDPVIAHPRGRDWVMVDSSSDNFTVWQRKAVSP
jgi:hypothetical protein